MTNTLDKKEYIKEHIIWGIIFFLWGKTLFFKCIPHCTYIQTFFIFLGMSVCVIGTGIFLTWKKDRNYFNVFGNVIMTWGLFVILAYSDFYKKPMLIIALVTVLISVIMTLIIMARKINNPDKRKKIIQRRFQNVVAFWRRCITCASLVLLIPLGMSTFLYGSFMSAQVDATKVYGEEHSLDANIDEISKIAPELWKDLDIQERLNVCQVIVNTQARYLGVSHEIGVGISDLPGEGELAYYSETNHRITIDSTYLTHAYSYDILESILHECHHAYQIEQVLLYNSLDEEYRNLLMFYDASVYIEELAHYKDGSEDYAEYYTQKLEIDAREAGEKEALDYIKHIYEYLYGENKDDTYEVRTLDAIFTK